MVLFVAVGRRDSELNIEWLLIAHKVIRNVERCPVFALMKLDYFRVELIG
jgi:hypothetical protein